MCIFECTEIEVHAYCVRVQLYVWTERFTSTFSHQKEVVTANHLMSTSILTMTPNSSSMPSVLWRCWFGSRKGIRPVKTEWWDAGMVMCVGQGADLYMVQLMPLPLNISCSSKSRLVLPFWCWLTRVVPDKIQEGHKMVVCVYVCLFIVIGDGAVAPSQIREKKYFSGKHHVIFGQLIYFWKKEEQVPFIFWQYSVFHFMCTWNIALNFETCFSSTFY